MVPIILQRTKEIGAGKGKAAGFLATAMFGTVGTYKDLEGAGVAISGSGAGLAAGMSFPIYTNSDCNPQDTFLNSGGNCEAWMTFMRSLIGVLL